MFQNFSLSSLISIILFALVGVNCSEDTTVLFVDSGTPIDTVLLDVNNTDLVVQNDPGTPLDTNTTKPFPNSPNDLIDLNLIADIPSLDLAWDQNQSGPEPSANGLVYRLAFSFTSQEYGGVPWRHTATLYLPTQQSRGSDDLLAVIQQGELNIGGDPATAFKNSFGIYIVRDMNIPVLMVEHIIPENVSFASGLQQQTLSGHPECIEAPISDQDFTNCALRMVQATEEAKHCPFSASTRVFMRAVTAAREIVKLASSVRTEIPVTSLTATSIVYGGEGLAGFASRQALAVDPLADGSLSVGADMGNLTEFNSLQAAVWPEGPYWLDPTTLSALSNTPRGLGYLQTFDIKSFADLLQGKRLAMAIGTNDPRFPIGSMELYANSIFAEIIPLYLRNETDGWVDQSVASLWRVLLNRVLHDLEPPKIVTQLIELGGNTILQASVSGCIAINGLQCNVIQGWQASIQNEGDDADFRDVTWTPLSLTLKQSIGETSTYEGVVDTTTLPTNSAVFVQITDIRDTWSAFVTSRLVFVGQPYPFP